MNQNLNPSSYKWYQPLLIYKTLLSCNTTYRNSLKLIRNKKFKSKERIHILKK